MANGTSVATGLTETSRQSLRRRAGLENLVSRVLRAHAPFLLLVTLHLGCALAASFVLGLPYRSGMLRSGSLVALQLAPASLIVLLVWRALVITVGIRPERPLMVLLHDVRRVVTDPERLLGGALVLLGILVFMGSFTFLKEVIPAIQPFAWDAAFAQVDEAIHGTAPYRLLWPLLGSGPVTTAVSGLYQIWFFVLFHCVLVAAFSKGTSEVRLAFLNAFVLTWGIGGNLLATLFASAGPVFYERLGLGADFAPLMGGLWRIAESSPVWALGVQEALWAAYRNGGGAIAGISAMPSMHVASAVLFCFFAFGFGRMLGWAAILFAAAILLGSVHLGWHYAVDGYVSLALAPSCWWAARKLQGLNRRSDLGPRGHARVLPPSS